MWLAVGTDCQCPACCVSNPSPTYQPAYRLACEARYLLTVPLAERRAYLAHKNVEPLRKELEAAILKEWEARKGG